MAKFPSTTLYFVALLIALCCASLISAQDGEVVPDVLHFVPTAGHLDNNLFTDFDGYVTCNREGGCPQTDILAITINNSHPEMDTRSKFVMIDVYLEDGTIMSVAPLNQTVYIGITSKLPMKIKRPLTKGETLYFSGQLEWHGVSETGTTTIEFGYGINYDAALKKTYPQPFYLDIKQSDDVFPSLETKTLVAPSPYDFTLYIQTPHVLTSRFSFRPFGGIFYVDAKCTVDNLPMTLTVNYDPADTLKKFPGYGLTIPPNNIHQYQTFKANTMVEIACTGFSHNTGSINRGFTVLFYDQKDVVSGVVTIHHFQKALTQQLPTMALADGTVTLDVINDYAYSMKGEDIHGNQKHFSYHTIQTELTSPNLTFPSNKTMHLFLDGIGGGAISLARWSLTLRDSDGKDLPYTTTDKLKVAWYADGKVARFDTWVISLPTILRQRYDPTKGARLTITYVLSFEVTSIAPPVLSPTTMVGIEQDVHWINYATKTTMTFYQFGTPVLSRKAMVASENFVFNAFHYEHDEEDTTDHEKEANIITASMSTDPHSPDYIGTPILFGFNVTIANVQYLDFERPPHFALALPLREFNFAGRYDDCKLNEDPINIVDPADITKPLLLVNHQTLVFNQTLKPSVNYQLVCPHAYLTNSSSSSSDRHKDKEIIVQFITSSSSPETNFYNMVASSFVSWGHPEHNTGTVFATVTMLTMSALFAGIIVWIVLDRRRKNRQQEANGGRDEVHLTDSESPHGINGSPQQQQQQPGQYQHFSDE